jgi:hypothetical protein|tara:strand:- start:3564 stop:4289 length:726 start_codon:yes stop_codon:yes gene_type:complete
MLTLLRRIRKSLIDSGSARKYLLYAIGEIALVVIGILMALQINNWRQEEITQKLSNDLFINLKASLRQDSVELVHILQKIKKCGDAEEIIIGNNYQSLNDQLSRAEITELLRDLDGGIYSFFPRFGVYNNIVQNNYLSLLKQKQLKADLIFHYEHLYVRYNAIDAEITEIFITSLLPTITKDISFVPKQNDLANLKNFKKFYDQIQQDCRLAHTSTFNQLSVLTEIQRSTNSLIERLELEI